MQLSDIKPYERNPRKNDDAVQYVANSIKEFGWQVPIVIDTDGVIIAGHTRYKAAKQLGIQVVPCVIADNLTEEQIKAYRLADNKVSEAAEWDADLLNMELSDIFNVDMEGFGFNLDDITPDIDEPEANTEQTFNYNEQYAVIVTCADESAQEKVYNALTAEGYTCKVVSV